MELEFEWVLVGCEDFCGLGLSRATSDFFEIMGLYLEIQCYLGFQVNNSFDCTALNVLVCN